VGAGGSKPGKPAAVEGDLVVGVDTHVVLVPSPGGPVPTPMPLPFNGPLASGLASNVTLNGKPVAIVGSVANNSPAHVPPGGTFQTPPSNRASVLTGSASVMVNNKPLARAGDTATTCNDPADQPVGSIVATANLIVGD
jgi:uncharacterized Zn-binding protein involved in type VI secretion